MQQPREPELNFNQVKKDINLVDLVLTLGYQHNRAKSGSDIEKGKFHTFDYKGKPGLDQVIIYKNPAGDYLYFNRADDRDKGSVIDFLKHRIENPRIDGVMATPGKNIWASVIENAKRFLNLPAAERSTSHQLQQRIEPVQRGDAYVPDFLRKTTPLTDTAYLMHRGLSPETLASPLFAGRILNHVHTGETKDGRPYKFVNTAFPQLYQDSIVGLEIKANGFKGQAADSLNSAALWLSNTNSKTTTLVVAESAIDALSHYQLKQPTNALYASTSGQLTDNKVTELKHLVENNNLKTVKLALDNNLEGHLFDTRMIVGLARPATPMGIVRTLPGLITVAIHSVQDEPVSRLHREAKAYNQQVLENYRKVAGPEAASGPTLDIELIKASKVGDHSYQFHVPKRLETLSAFNQALINAFPMVAKVELEKSKANDWNDQLKEQLKEKAQTIGQEPGKEPEQEPRPRRGPRL
ncbi:toprim domain-containing protein [Hymenobacter psoromatis]|uniref:toprim domain-containing protein n=1 Tax=Hymenobacter psoromatis TaxID=1484116 RepID=UPI001CBBDD0D|nr:toprim domain-containing protein [Hymenobacter psoromatis]